MMIPCRYIDPRGTEYSEFHFDGQNLSIELRGIQFKGESFDGLEGQEDSSEFDYTEVDKPDYDGSWISWYDTLNEQIPCLTNCVFDLEMPIVLLVDQQEVALSMNIVVDLLDEDAKKTIMESDLQYQPSGIEDSIELYFTYKNIQYHGSASYAELIAALWDLQEQLPQNMQLKTCLFCQYAADEFGGIVAGLSSGCIKCSVAFKDKWQEALDLKKDRTEIIKMLILKDAPVVLELHSCTQFDPKSRT